MPDAALAARLGVNPSAVGVRRRILGIPPYAPAPRRVVWTKKRLALVERFSDREVARRLRIAVTTVAAKRATLGPRVTLTLPKTPKKIRELLRSWSDSELRRTFGLLRAQVTPLRRRYGILAPGAQTPIPKRLLAKLGKETDRVIARAAHCEHEHCPAAARRTRHTPAPATAMDACGNRTPWNKSDDDVAASIGKSPAAVKHKRRAERIPAF
jgi:hypothetical protein